MMRAHFIAAGALLAGAGAMGVRAGDTADLQGSLFEFTSAVMAACPGSGGPYRGMGSEAGQSALVAGTQQVAPMGRFLDAKACTGPAASPESSQGLVIGLDSIAIIASERTAGACNGDPNSTCDSAFEPESGVAYDTTIVGSDGVPYTFNGWRDVLRVLLAGFQHDNVGTGSTQWVKRNCLSPVRQALADNYGAFFENGNCAAAAGEAPGDASFSPGCTKIRHIFRPDDFSPAAEMLVNLLGLPPIVLPETTVGGALQHTGASPFCNAVRPAFVYPIYVPVLQGSDATWDPTSTEVVTNGRETAVYRATMQDNDPIRRLCAGTGAGTAAAEDVCSSAGDLGLVLPVNAIDESAPNTATDRYNAAPCGRARITVVAAPDVFDAAAQTKISCATGLLCPNGDVCNPLGGCYAPADNSGNPKCLATRLTTPALTVNSLAVPRANPRPPALSDGRAYNLHLYDAAGGYQMVSAQAPLPMTGAYYRIHTLHSLNAQSITCQQADPTLQMGCLAVASPCSLGLARRQVLATSTGVAALKINKQSPEPACIEDRFRYPLSTKLYFNSVAGFADVTGQELQLSRCMTDLAQPSSNPPTPAGLVSANIVAFGFLPLPASVNGGEPYCEDFAERQLCASSAGDAGISNVDACRAPTANFDAFPEFHTLCGDGHLDPLEECDDGDANGGPPAACSYFCRFNR